MRFTTDLIASNQLRLDNDIWKNRPLVFSRDLIYYVTHKYRRQWKPFFYKTYSIHEMSPLTHSVRKAVDLLLDKMDEVYTFNYNRLVEPYGEDKLAHFVNFCQYIIDRYKKMEKKAVNILFDVLLFVARFGVECEIHGVRDAPNLAVVLINLFLLSVQREVYELLHQHALDVIQVYSEHGEVAEEKRVFYEF